MATSRSGDEVAHIGPPTACRACGAESTDGLDVLTWVLDRDGDDHVWTCVDCTRPHVRDIEGRIDTAYWTFDTN